MSEEIKYPLLFRERRIQQVQTQLLRTPKSLPWMKINPSVSDLFAFTFDDFTLEGYEAEPSIAAPIAF